MLQMSLHANALFSPPSPARDETTEESIPVNPTEGTRVQGQGSGAPAKAEATAATPQTNQAEQDRPIVVLSSSSVDGDKNQKPQLGRKSVPCLQMPVYPEGTRGFFVPKTIEEYKALLVLASRSTWKPSFSEVEYLKMEKWLGLDKYRPKVANRVCVAPAAAPNADIPGGSTKSVKPEKSPMPTVVVPAEPNGRKSPTPVTRPRGTYF